MRELLLLAESANQLAKRLPTWALESFASSIQQSDLQTDILQIPVELGSLELRLACKEFQEAWINRFIQLPRSPIVASLITAANAADSHREDPNIQLVWTGPDVSTSEMRHTEQAILEVIAKANERLLIVCFAVFRIPRICRALEDAAARGIHITLIVETPDLIEDKGDYETLRALSDGVRRTCMIYFWPRTKRPVDAGGRSGLLHVKCLVADGHSVLLSSANLTEYAFTTNMELGLLMRSASVGSQIEKQVMSLIENTTFERIAETQPRSTS